MSPLTITIDGPAGVGKSTIAQSLAAHLQIPYLNSGSLYRAVAWTVSKRGVKPDNEEAVFNVCEETQFVLSAPDDCQSVTVNGTRLTHELHTPHITLLASEISRHPTVRAFLRPIQRGCADEKGIVAEGRDMGTHVFTDAQVKVFLDASPTVRAQRRFRQLQNGDASVSRETTTNELYERDSRDTTRDTAPLRPATDATIIDTTKLSASEVVDAILAVIERQAGSQADRIPAPHAMKRTSTSY